MEQSEPSAFGVLLRRHRIENGLTQEELGERARLSARTVSDIERGIARRPQTHTALQLADALGLDGVDRDRFLDAARGRQAASAQDDERREPVRIGAAAPSHGAEAVGIPEAAQPVPSPAGILTFPGPPQEQLRPDRVRRQRPELVILVAAAIALVVTAALILAGRAVGGSTSLASTAARPAVIGTMGTHITGPFPLPHMWNLAVLPNGRIAVITYAGSDEAPIEKGVAELSSAGDLLWSWGFTSARQAALSGLAGDASGNLYLAARYFKEVDKFSPDGRLLARWGPGLGLEGPTRIALDGHGNLWVLDFDRSRVVKLSPSGKLLAAYGSSGLGMGQFNNPDGLAIGRNGNLYIVDWTQDRVTEYSPDGKPLRDWGTTGSGPGQFLSSRGLATDSAGNVYVADTGNARIQKFSADGRLLAVWGRRGTGPGELAYPVAVSIASDGNVYVADDGFSHYCGCSGADRIEVFSPSGTYLSQLASSALRRPLLSDVAGLAVDGRGDVYVTDDVANRVVEFGPSRTPVAHWGGKLSAPAGLTVDRSGAILVADHDNNRVIRLSARGTVAQQWRWKGALAYERSFPAGLATDAAGHVFVADNINGQVQEVSPRGTLVRRWTATFTGGSQIVDGAIAVGPRGSVYVGNNASTTVDLYTPTGRYLRSLGGQGAGVGSLRSITGLAVDAHGRVYVADRAGKAVVVYSPSGSVLARWTASRFPALGVPRAITLDRAGNIYVGGGRQVVELAPLS
jgi:DNA-binding beta-propeller fold protein YncE/transcriptional regulator with XRE-family HTH domain